MMHNKTGVKSFCSDYNMQMGAEITELKNHNKSKQTTRKESIFYSQHQSQEDRFYWKSRGGNSRDEC